MDIHNLTKKFTNAEYNEVSWKPLDIKYGKFYINYNSDYMILIYLWMGIFGIAGNLATCVVIISNKTMRTITNCYLFNLAITDLMILFWDFPPLNGYTKYESELICILRGWIAESSVYASVLTISAFSIERYIAICYPFFIKTLSKLFRFIIVIPLIWLFALLCALPLTLQLGLIHHLKDQNLAICTITKEIIPHSLILSSLLFFVTPMFLICALYTTIGFKLKKNKQTIRNNWSRNEKVDMRIDRNNKKVLRMLVVVVAAFFICWAPFHLQRVLSIYFKFTNKTVKIHAVLTYISSISYYSSAIINPILYNIMSDKFRRAFKDTLLQSYKILQSIHEKINKFMIFYENNVTKTSTAEIAF